MLINNKTLLVFDLDDTLYKEIDFLISAYKEIAQYLLPNNWQFLLAKMISLYRLGKNVFEFLSKEYKINVEVLLSMYRNHFPNIKLSKNTKEFLDTIKSKNITCVLLTDGRSITQQNKIKALELEKYFDNNIIISEEFGSTKKEGKSFLYLNEKFPDFDKFYIGDNIEKDFIVPNSLGWKTICLIDDTKNIHKNDYEKLGISFSPKFFIAELKDFLN